MLLLGITLVFSGDWGAAWTRRVALGGAAFGLAGTVK